MGYKASLVKLRTFVDTSEQRVKSAKGHREKGAIGKVLEIYSWIQHEESKDFPDFHALHHKLLEAIDIINNLDTYASLDGTELN